MGKIDSALLALLAKRVVKAEKHVGYVAKQEGPQGERGLDGAPGATGATGMQGARGPQGYAGERGPQGATGETGPAGADGQAGMPGADGKAGLQGVRGQAGEQGQKGDTGPAPAHEWQGTKLRFQKPDGKWGKYTELKGKDGKEGRVGVISVNRSSGTSLESLTPGADGVEPVGIAVMQNGQWVNLPWSAFISVIAGAVDMGSPTSRRTDFVGDSLLYRGEAVPGAAETDPVWAVRRIEFLPGGDVVEKWAAGSSAKSFVWSDRAAYEYL